MQTATGVSNKKNLVEDSSPFETYLNKCIALDKKKPTCGLGTSYTR